MKKCILTFPAIAIVCLSLAAILAYPKLMDNQDKISPEFVPLTAAEMPRRERFREKEDDGPVMIHVSGLKAQLESRQVEIEKTTDLLNK
jgi:SpoU rRNA methylase family enzyme